MWCRCFSLSVEFDAVISCAACTVPLFRFFLLLPVCLVFHIVVHVLVVHLIWIDQPSCASLFPPIQWWVTSGYDTIRTCFTWSTYGCGVMSNSMYRESACLEWKQRRKSNDEYICTTVEKRHPSLFNTLDNQKQRLMWKKERRPEICTCTRRAIGKAKGKRNVTWERHVAVTCVAAILILAEWCKNQSHSWINPHHVFCTLWCVKCSCCQLMLVWVNVSVMFFSVLFVSPHPILCDVAVLCHIAVVIYAMTACNPYNNAACRCPSITNNAICAFSSALKL